MNKINLEYFKFQFISISTLEIDRQIYFIKQFLQEGGKWLQLRLKFENDRQMGLAYEIAIKIRDICKDFGATLIINDYLDLCQAVSADGVHLGKNDLPLSVARQILGNKYIIGATANNFNDIENSYNNGADYVGLGPFAFTETKKNLSQLLGLNKYIEIIEKMKEKNITIPLVAIGGIKLEHTKDLLDCGVNGIAVSGAITRAENILLNIRNFIEIIEK